MYRWCNRAVVWTLMGLTACQSSPPLDGSWPTPRPLGHQLDAYRPPSQPDETDNRSTADRLESQDPPNPSGELTLRQAMALALIHSPKLRAYGWDVRRAEAQILQAGRWPNPELEVEFENFAGSGDLSDFKSLETTISLAQTFPLGGAINRRLVLAQLEAQSAGWDYEAARLDLLTQVTQRYVSVMTWQRRVTLMQGRLASFSTGPRDDAQTH